MERLSVTSSFPEPVGTCVGTTATVVAGDGTASAGSIKGAI